MACGDGGGTSIDDDSESSGSSTSGTSSADTGSTDEGTPTTSVDESSSGDTGSGGDNTAPNAQDDVFYGVQGEPLQVDASAGALVNDVDPDDDALTVVAADALSLHAGEVVVDVDGSVSYTPAPGVWGPDSFGYTVSDGTAEASAQITVYVAPVLVPLSGVAGGMGGFVMDGEAADDQSGLAVSDAGDVDGDGLADVLVGAPFAAANGPRSGRVYVIFGRADSDGITLDQIAAGNGGFAIDGEAAFDGAGTSVSAAGDVNGDGLADILVGAPDAPAGVGWGRSYVVFGKADTDTVQLGDIAAGEGGGIALVGDEAEAHAGTSVSGAGDVDGDGLADVIVGAPDAHDDASGRAYLVLGTTDTDPIQLSEIVSGSGGFVLEGAAAGERAGGSVSGAGDVDGDGLVDVIVGADGAAPNGTDSGRAYVVFGKADTNEVLLADIIAGTGGFALDGASADGYAGASVSGAGDVDGDGLADVIVGAWAASPRGFASGEAYVVFGKADTATIQLADVEAGSGGFALTGETPSAYAGFSVSDAGDVDGDGLADLIVGAQGVPDGSASGRSYVVFGKADTQTVELGAVAEGTGGFALDGEAGADYVGFSVSGAGDVDGDGWPDVVVGARGADPGGANEAGRSYVVFGVPRMLKR